MKTPSGRAALAIMIASGVVALTLAVGGGAVAGSLVTSAQIQDDTVRSVDVKDDTLRLTDLSDGARTALTGLSGYVIVVRSHPHELLPIEYGDFDVRCPAGKRPLGGGGLVQLYSATGSFVHLGAAPIGSEPYNFGSTAGFDLTINQPAVDGAVTAKVTVEATCAAVAP